MNRSEHDMPLADRLVNDIVCDWLDRKTGTALAASDTPEARKAIERMRHLHLDNYWYDLVPKILDALRRADRLPTGTA